MLLTKLFEQRSIGFAPECKVREVPLPLSHKKAVLARQYKPFRQPYGTRTPVHTGGITEHSNCETISHGAGYMKKAQDGMACDERSSFKVGIPKTDADGKSVLKMVVKTFSGDQSLDISKRLSGPSRDMDYPEPQHVRATELEVGYMQYLSLHPKGADVSVGSAPDLETFYESKSEPPTTARVREPIPSRVWPRKFSGPASTMMAGPKCGPWLSHSSAERHPLQNRVGVYNARYRWEACGTCVREEHRDGKYFWESKPCSKCRWKVTEGRGEELLFTDEVRKAGKPDLYNYTYQPKPVVLRGRMRGVLNPLAEVNHWLEDLVKPQVSIVDGKEVLVSGAAWYEGNPLLPRKPIKPEDGGFRLQPDGTTVRALSKGWFAGGKHGTVERVQFADEKHEEVYRVQPAGTLVHFCMLRRESLLLPELPVKGTKRTAGPYLPYKRGWACDHGHNLLQWHRVAQLHDSRTELEERRRPLFDITTALRTDGHGNLSITIAKVIVPTQFEQVSRRYPSYDSEVNEVVKIIMQDGTIHKVCKDDVGEYIREKGGTKELCKLQKFMDKMQHYKLKKLPYYNATKKTWEIRFVKAGLPQLTLGEWRSRGEGEGVIRDENHYVHGLGKDERKGGKVLSWTETRTHCNLIVREMRRESLDTTYWDGLAAICQSAGGTVAKGFDPAPPLCILGKSRVWVSEDVADRLRAFDAGTGDDSADVFAQEYPNEFVESAAVLPVYTPTAEDVKQGYCVLEKPPELRRDDVDPNEEVAVLGEEEEPEEVAQQ